MTRHICSALLLFALLGQAAAQGGDEPTPSPQIPTPEEQQQMANPQQDTAPPSVSPPATSSDVLPSDTLPTDTLPTDTLPSSATPGAPAPAAAPTPPAAPLISRLYAGASVMPGSGGTAYGIVVGSSQVFGPFGAQVGIDYVTASGALSVDALLLFRPTFTNRFKPYAGGGLGLTSSSAANSDITSGVVQNATDYAGQVALGSDYLLTDSIAANAELSYRFPFSSKGTANGGGLRGRLGLKFLF